MMSRLMRDGKGLVWSAVKIKCRIMKYEETHEVLNSLAEEDGIKDTKPAMICTLWTIKSGHCDGGQRSQRSNIKLLTQ